MTRIHSDSITKPSHLFKKSALALCVAAVTYQVSAQEQPAQVEEVIVYGVKQSLSTAQDLKRDAATVKDIITASDIGALPDKSVVEALQRVPGVAIERFESSEDPDHFSVEGSKVTIRGLNRVKGEFNGRDAFSAGADGGLSFSDIPPELVGSVEVSKNSVASQIEGGTAGTVNLITRKPLDNDGLSVTGSIRASYGDLIDEVTPTFSFIASNTWDTDAGTFGALISISGSEFTSRGDSVGVYNYYGQYMSNPMEVRDNPSTVEPIFESFMDQLGNPAAVPFAGAVRQQFNDRERLGMSGSLQWESPNEDILATLEFIRSDSTLAWNERFIEFPGQPFSTDDTTTRIQDLQYRDVSYSCPQEPSFENPCLFNDGTIIGGGAPWGVGPYTTGTRSRQDERVINDVSLNLQWNVTDNFKVTGDVQWVDATQDVIDNTAHGKFFPNGVYLNVGGHTPQIEFLKPDAAAGIGSDTTLASEYHWRSAMDHISQNEGEQKAFQLDAEYTVEDSLLLAVKTGVRFSNRDMTIRDSDYNWGVVTETWREGGEAEFSELEGTGYIDQFTFDDHLSGKALQTGNDTFWFPSLSLLNGPNANGLYTAFQNNDEFYNLQPGPDGIVGTGDDVLDFLPCDPGVSDGNCWQPLSLRADAIDGTPFLASEIYPTEEERSAFYVQFDFGDEDADQPWSGNIGFRYVDWQVTSTGASQFPEGFSDEELGIGRNPALPELNSSLTPEQIAFANGTSGETITIKGDKFSRVLPSFNIKYGVTEDFILRFAASETIWLPNLIQLRNALSIDKNVTRVEGDLDDDMMPDHLAGVGLDNFTANGGNPYLQPELSSNYDLAFEYYFGEDVGSLTATLFYKRIRDFHRQASENIPILNPDAGVSQPVENTSTFNSGIAEVQGYELAYQTMFDAFFGEAFEDFGTQLSYTKIDGEEESSAQPRYDDAEQSFRRFTELPIEGLSKDNYNVTVFYDNGTFDARFAYSWRSRFLLNSRDVIAFSPVYGEATGQLDASFSYNINDDIEVGLEANNLTDEVIRTSIQYNQEGVLTPRSFFTNDRRFSLFLRAKY